MKNNGEPLSPERLHSLKMATLASLAAKARRLERGLAIAREHWGRPPGEISIKEIMALSGLGRRTLYDHLGRRELAQEERVKGKRHV